MAQQPFRIDGGLQIDDIGSFLTGTGLPGSGTNDSNAQIAEQGSLYFRVGASAALFQKTGTGATTGDWEALVLNNSIADLTALRTLTGTSTLDTDLGTFTGDVVPDAVTIKGAIQSLESYAEATRSLVSNFEWQESVLDRFDPTAALPAAPAIGDRYLATATANGWTNNYIYEWDGAAWVETIPTTGTYVSVDDEPTVIYAFGGSSWSAKAFESTTASTGLVKVGNDIQLLDANAGGIVIASGAFSLNVDDSTVEVNAGTLRVKADGIDGTHIDFGTTGDQVNAGLLPIIDAGALITATTVEGALAEAFQAVNAISDNTITSPNGSIASAGTIGGDNQTVDVVFSTTGEANRSIQASDLASTANGLGASLIGVEDADGDYTATTQEGVNAEIGDRLIALEAVTPVPQENFLGLAGGAATTVASVLVDEVIEVTYRVVVTETGTGDRESFSFDVLHDGTSSADATSADNNAKYARLKLGKVNGLSVTSSVNGTGAAQTMDVTITASNGHDISIKEINRLVF